ncbi:MAG: hypothetical protein HN719_03425 [Alphaproteobacteria bacterium]|nr:hypothetical protein [Alphaproteobacteria bacterium]
MNIKTTLKSSVAVAALFAVAAPVANAADDTLKSGNKNSLSITGQVVSAIWNADDGTSSGIFITDGRITRSRVRWIAQGSLNANVTAGATIEINIPVANNPGAVTLGTKTADGTDLAAITTWGTRHHYVWVSHKKFGKLTLGNTGQGTEGSGEANLSGTTLGGSLMAGGNFGSAIVFNETSGAQPSQTSMTIGTVMSNYDAGTRREVLRYDTPKLYGAQIRTALVNGGSWDVGLFYGAKFGGFKIDARAGYYDQAGTSATTNYSASGSISVLHDSGLNATFNKSTLNYVSDFGAGATKQATIEDPTNTYWSVGYQAKLFGVGGTNFEVGFSNTEDRVNTLNFDNTDATAWHLTAVQKFDAIGANVTLNYSNYALDADNAGAAYTFDDIDVFALQTIFAF